MNRSDRGDRSRPAVRATAGTSDQPWLGLSTGWEDRALALTGDPEPLLRLVSRADSDGIDLSGMHWAMHWDGTMLHNAPDCTPATVLRLVNLVDLFAHRPGSDTPARRTSCRCGGWAAGRPGHLLATIVDRYTAIDDDQAGVVDDNWAGPWHRLGRSLHTIGARQADTALRALDAHGRAADRNVAARTRTRLGDAATRVGHRTWRLNTAHPVVASFAAGTGPDAALLFGPWVSEPLTAGTTTTIAYTVWSQQIDWTPGATILGPADTIRALADRAADRGHPVGRPLTMLDADQLAGDLGREPDPVSFAELVAALWADNPAAHIDDVVDTARRL